MSTGFVCCRKCLGSRGCHTSQLPSSARSNLDIEYFLDEPVGVGSTPAKAAFHPECLLSDLSRNPEFVLPDREERHLTHARQKLLPWCAQEGMFASFMVDVDRDLDDPS